MSTRTYSALGVMAALVVAGVIVYLQSFDAEKVSCIGISEARTSLQTMYDTGVAASVQIYADEKSEIDERLSQCLNAKPLDPCADAQKVRDAAVAGFNGIPSPPDTAPYPEFQSYFTKRDDAYANYKKSKETLEQCRAANPPKGDVPYEKSDGKACFDAYDAAVQSARDAYGRDTQTMRAALKTALTALDAREKACHPPVGKEKFTEPPRTGGTSENGGTPRDLASCKPISAELDSELFTLRQRAAALPAEIQAAQTSIDNVQKRMKPIQRDLADVGTYIPPESTRTQFEGTLNALRAERKVAIESSLEFYKNMLSKRQGEKATLDQELRDVEAKIKTRFEEIRKENATRQRNFPTSLHQSKPDACAYYHCHGMLCGIPDPAPHECGQGATTQEDTECIQFIDSYLKAAGVN